MKQSGQDEEDTADPTAKEEGKENEDTVDMTEDFRGTTENLPGEVEEEQEGEGKGIGNCVGIHCNITGVFLFCCV